MTGVKNMSLKKILLFTVGFSVCALAAGVYTTGSVADGWRTHGANDVMIQSYAGACHRADSGGGDYFVPSRTPAEWNAVTTQPPGGLTITACACEPLAIQGCPVANGTGTQQCWTNGANWTACTITGCNAGYTSDGTSCVANPPPPPVYTYVWRSFYWGGSNQAYFTSGGGNTGNWYELEDICHRVEDNVSVADSYCNLATKSAARRHWVFVNDQSIWIDEYH